MGKKRYIPESDNTRLVVQRRVPGLLNQRVQVLSATDSDYSKRTSEMYNDAVWRRDYPLSSKFSDVMGDIAMMPHVMLDLAYLEPKGILDEIEYSETKKNNSVSGILNAGTELLGFEVGGEVIGEGISKGIGIVNRMRQAREIKKTVKELTPLQMGEYEREILSSVNNQIKKPKNLIKISNAMDKKVELLSSEEGRRRMRAFDNKFDTGVEAEFDYLFEKGNPFKGIATDKGMSYGEINIDVSSMENAPKLKGLKKRVTAAYAIKNRISKLEKKDFLKNNLSKEEKDRLTLRFGHDYLHDYLAEHGKGSDKLKDVITFVADENGGLISEKYSMQEIAGHEIDHLLNTSDIERKLKFEEYFDDIFYKPFDERSVYKKYDFNLDKVDYMTNPTEIKSYIDNNLRGDLVKFGYIKHPYDLITEEHVKALRGGYMMDYGIYLGKNTINKIPIQTVYLLNVKGESGLKKLVEYMNKYGHAISGGGVVGGSLLNNKSK